MPAWWFNRVCTSVTSDHHLTSALLRIRKCRPTPVVVQTRSWKSIDIDSFRARLADVDWSPVFVTDNVQRQSDIFIHQFTAVLDEQAPVRRVRIRNPRPPPVTAQQRRGGSWPIDAPSYDGETEPSTES